MVRNGSNQLNTGATLMNSASPAPSFSDVQQVLATAMAHHIERLTKEEVQDLVEKARLDLQTENDAMKKRIAQLEHETKQLEQERNRLAWALSRRLFDEKDWEAFDPDQYKVSKEEILAALDQVN